MLSYSYFIKFYFNLDTFIHWSLGEEAAIFCCQQF